jgi:hypothetical protein
MRFNGFLNGSTLGLLLLPLAFAALGADAGRTNSAPGKSSYSDFSVISDRNIFNAKRYPRSSATVVRSDNTRAVRTEYFALLGIISYEKGPFAFFDGSSSSSRKSATVNDEISGFKIKAILRGGVELESGTNHFKLPLGKQLCRPAAGGQWQVADRTEAVYASNDRRRDDRSSGDRRRDDRSSGDRGEPAAAFSGQVFEGGSSDQPAIMMMPGGADGTMVISISNGDSAQPSAEGAVTITPGAPTAAPATGGSENDVLRRLMQRREQELNR